MTVSGPTQGAARHTDEVERWSSHPRLARLLRAVVLAAPIVVAILLTWGAGRLLPPDRLGVGRWTWVLGAFVVCNAALVWMGKLTRRLTPLIALMKLTLVFPDQAPSRARATLRKSSSRTLLRQIEEARARGDQTGGVLHGEYLVHLLRELNQHDRLTRGHSERVRAYSEMLGEELGLPEEQMQKLRWAALLHDVGKLEVPEEILNKDGRPDAEEWAILSTHPAAGGRMLAPLESWLGEWTHAADQHHLRWEGGGYPESDLSGTDITVAGRLVAIADAYDVMTSPRSYKAPLSAEVARRELTACAGSQFDPQMVRAFLNIGLGRLRAVAGPLAWLANALGSTQVPVPVATTAVTTAGTGFAAAAAVSIAAVTGGIGTSEPPPEPVARQVAPVEELEVEVVEVEVVDISVVAREDEPLTIRLRAEGDAPVTFEVGGAAHGQVVMGRIEMPVAAAVEIAETIVTYVPDPDYHGGDAFGFEACDATGSCDVATVTVRVEPVNDAPTIMADGFVGVAGTVIELDVVANDVDVDGDALRVVEVSPSPDGSIRIVDGRIYFVPGADVIGTVLIDYVVADPSGARAVGRAIVEVTPGDPTVPPATVPPATTTQPVPTTTTTVVANDPPIPNDDSATVVEDGSVLIGVLANDTDPEGKPLTITGIGTPLHGAAGPVGDQIRYTPFDHYWGSDTFAYTVSDGANPPVGATVTITVSPANDAPAVMAPDVAVPEDATTGTGVLTVVADDTDGDALSYAIASGDPGSTFAIDGGGRVTLAGSLDHEIAPSYTLGFTVDDGTVVVPVAATVTVTDVDETPTAGDDSAATSEDIPVAIDIGLDDDDPEGQALTFAVPASSVAGGTLAESGGTVTYTPPIDWSGNDSFTYTVADPRGNVSAPATVTIVVTAVNDAPEAGDDSGVGFTTPEDTLITTPDVTANDTDVDHPVDPTSIRVVTPPATGTLTDNGDGTFDYDPDPDFNGTDTFTYTITDPGGLPSNVATVSLEVTATNDPPVAADDGGAGFTTLEDTLFTTAAVTTNDTDIEDGTIDPTTVTVLTLPTDGTLTDNGDGTFDYDPDPDFNGTDTFTYQVNDTGPLISNTATVTITITADNDAPVANPDGGLSFATLEDTLFTTPLVTANDTDVDHPVDSTTATIDNPTSQGTVVGNGNGTFDYDPDPDVNGTDTFTYTITDPGLLVSNDATVTIIIVAVNDEPSFTPGADVTVTQSSGDASIAGWATDLRTGPADESGQTLTFTVTNDNPTLFASAPAVSPAGTLTFTPVPGQSGSATVDVTLGDDGGTANGGDDTSPTVQFTITVESEDFDAVPTVADNCPTRFNPDQFDTDGDGTGDACDTSPTLASTADFVISQALGSSNSQGVALGDVDGDGDLDVVFANDNDPSRVWRNDGTGTYTDTGQALGAADAVAAALADLDADGDLDLVFAQENFSPNTVWRNDGTGTFTDSGQALGGAWTEDVVFGDLDGDGDLDLVFANSGVSESFWLNDGTGTFTDSGQTTGSAQTEGLAIGDLDGDGDLDLVLANWGGVGRVWRNDGTGTYTDTGQALTAEPNMAVTLDDLDGDGDLDAVFVADNGPGTVWRNDGDGTFTDTGAPIATARYVDGAVGDLDGDGDSDALVTSRNAANTVLLNDGAAAFADTGQLLGAANSQAVALGDLDGDGDLDAVVANNGGGGEPNTVWLNEPIAAEDYDAVPAGIDNCPETFNPLQLDTDGDGIGDACDTSPTGASTAMFATTGQAIGTATSRFVALGDLDGDGDLDATFANKGDDNSVWFNDGSGAFIDSGQSLGSNGSVAAAIADLDGDGDLDIAYAQEGAPNSVWLNDGTGTFTDSGQALGNGSSQDVVAGDVDGDGDLDLVVANNGDPSTVWRNDGTGIFTDSGQSLGSGPTEGLAIGDLDGDGDLDLIFAGRLAPATVWTNDGTGVFTDSGQALSAATNMAVELGDLDGDGDLDAVIVGDNDATTIWRNDGTGTFIDTGMPIAANHDLDMVLGDLDGDGDLDLFAGSHTIDNRIHLNDGTGVFTDSGQVLGTGTSESVALGDLDGDGDLDAIAANKAGPGGEPNTVWLNS